MRFEQKIDGTVHVINLRGEHNTPAPQVGVIYNAFDDGKIRPSRLMRYKIEEAVDLDRPDIRQHLGDELWDAIRTDIYRCYWLFEPEQHIVYIGKAVDADGSYDKDIPTSVFLRTKHKEWFGTGDWWSPLLDTDNYYTRMMEEDYY